MLFSNGTVEKVKMRAGKILIPVQLTLVGSRIEFQFPFNRELMADIKTMEGHKWHGFEDPPRKIWSVANTFRNNFQLEFMIGNNPYAWFERPLEDVKPNRDCLMGHQGFMFATVITYRRQLLAAEMGTGKTLTVIEIAEWAKKAWNLQDSDIWYAGPRSGVKAVGLELIKWKSTARFYSQTYDGWVKTVTNWKAGTKAPRVFIIDESSRIKNPQAKRSKAVMHVCEAMRAEHGMNCIIVLLTGTPAPKSPVDFWSQCETAQPGYLKEGDPNKFKQRLCITEQRESLQGGTYPHFITWLDDEKKCAICGQYEGHIKHTYKDVDVTKINVGFAFGNSTSEKPVVVASDSNALAHDFKPSINEVAKLYRRMKGLVTVIYKKDCMDLPEKRYEIVKVTPTVEMLRAAGLIKRTNGRAITVLTLLRELSDGFQYAELPTGEKTQCPLCCGTGKMRMAAPVEDVQAPNTEIAPTFSDEDCPNCRGSGIVDVVARTVHEVGSPKDEALLDLVDSVEDVGRCIVWGGFEGSIDRIVKMVVKEGWTVLRIDGRGYSVHGAEADSDELLIAMDARHPRFKELREKHDKICVVGNPGAGGMALTLTASPVEIYYSNSFDGEARMQSEDRFHRIGADENRGCTIYDIFCLKSDETVLNNLKLKKRLQDLSLSDIEVS